MEMLLSETTCIAMHLPINRATIAENRSTATTISVNGQPSGHRRNRRSPPLASDRGSYGEDNGNTFEKQSKKVTPLEKKRPMHGAGGVYGAESRRRFPSVEGHHCIGQLTPPLFGTSMSHRTKGYKLPSVPTRYMYVRTCTCRYHYNDTGAHSYQ